MDIVRSGLLQIPLFHGTSSLFESSIRHFGFGGKDPIGETRVLHLFKDLVALCERHLSKDETWLMCSTYAHSIIAEETSEGNWRYGPCYLTPSKGRAVNHARNHSYGSELLSVAAILVRCIERRTVPEYPDLLTQYAPVFDLLTAEHRPLLLEAHNVPLSLLRSEDGGSAEELLQRVGAFASYLLDESASFPFGFQLTGPLACDQLSFSYP